MKAIVVKYHGGVTDKLYSNWFELSIPELFVDLILRLYSPYGAILLSFTNYLNTLSFVLSTYFRFRDYPFRSLSSSIL